jgi:hypothetical protein
VGAAAHHPVWGIATSVSETPPGVRSSPGLVRTGRGGGHRDRAGTSLNKAAGARARLALVIATVVMAVVILAFAGLVGYIATPGLAGLPMLIGCRTFKSAGLLSVWKPSRCKRQYC